MLRNLVVPAAILATALMTGCQTTQMQDNKPNTTPSVEQPSHSSEKPDSSSVVEVKKAPSQVEAPSKPKAPHLITIKEQIVQVPAHLDGRLVLGLEEEATLPNQGVQMIAKLDTGAANTSIDARNIQRFERDGKKWVRFNLPRTSKGLLPIELPVQEIIRIKRPGLEAIERPVVLMTVTIGELTQQVNVSLTDREKYSYPLLVGRNFMKDLAVIDVNKKNVAEKSLLGSRSLQVSAPEGKKPYTRIVNKPVSIAGLTTLGAIETVTLPDAGISLPARIDTGARTSSLDARELELFQKKHKDWVRFKVPHKKGMITVEEPVTRFVLIKRHGQESERRPVVTLKVQIGQLIQAAQFTLRSREGYDYPILIGERFLKQAAIVDVSRKNTSSAAQGDI